MAKTNQKLNLAEISLFAVMGSLTFGAKMAMMWLPNIEPVSLFVMLFAVIFGRKAIYPIYIYVFLEIAVYGLNLWSINYLYVWTVLAFAAWCLRKMTSPLSWAVFAAIFGLFFGLLCAPVYLFIGGPGAAVAWWIGGIPYDVIHCVSNFVVVLVLFIPLRRVLEQLCCRMEICRNL